MAFIRLLYKYLRFFGGSYSCIICNRRVRRFFPFSENLQRSAIAHGFPYDFKRMETLNWEQCNCPFCLSSDRERLYFIFIEEYVSGSTRDHSILEFAPNPIFSKRMREIPRVYYSSADLSRDDVDIRVNICNMEQITDHRFDIVICSHILEHVPDPDMAMREIFRVMTFDGLAIIMVPLFWDVTQTEEDATHLTDEARIRYYGQYDHVRLFSRQDFLNRLKMAGFAIQEVRPSELNRQKIIQNAIAENSILYVCTNTTSLRPGELNGP